MKAPYLFLIVILLFSANHSLGQSVDLPVDRPDQIELTFVQGLLLNTTRQEGLPINSGGSGTLSAGISFKLHFAQNTLGFRLQPSASWTRFSYEQAESKVFPTPFLDNANLTVRVEKHRIVFLDIPLGLFINILKDEDGDPRLFTEFGGFAGYKIGSVYKTRVENTLTDQETKSLVGPVKDLENWRYGLYARIGMRWLALHFSYRLSDVFQPSPENANGEPSGFEKIDLPPIELGVAFFL